MEDREWVDETRELMERLNCYLNKEGMERLIGIYLIEDDPKEKENIKNDIETVLGAYIPNLIFSKKPMLPSPDPEECVGEIELGNVIQGKIEIRPFSIGLNDINRHIAIFASTGSGKTTLIINILRQLLDRSIPFLYFDFKQDLRHLRDERIWVLRWDWLRINPLQPPKGIEARRWMQVLADICAHVFGWFHGSENYLMEFMEKLYSNHGDGYPTLRELYELMLGAEEKSRKRMEYLDVVMNRVKSLLVVLGEVVECREGFRFEELLKHPVVIELDGLRRDEQNFMVELLLSYIFNYRIANGHRGGLRHIIVFDEATRVFFKKREWRETTVELGMPFIDIIPQIIRDYSEGMIFAAQEPSQISHSVLANTNTKLVGFLGEGEDIDRISNSLGLEEEERSTISKLEKGEWLVKKPGLKPFIIRSPDFRLEKDVGDEELRARMQPILRRLDESVRPRRKEEVKRRDERRIPKLSEDARALLLDVNSHPFRGLSTRYKILEFSGKRAEAAKAELLQKRVVEEISIILGSYRPVKFLVLTELGIKYLKNEGVETELWAKVGNVGFEHRLYQVLLSYALKREGYSTFMEKTLGPVRMDVLAVREGEKIGVEIELDQGVDVEKILRSARELDRLVVLSRDQEAIDKIRERVEARAGNLEDKIDFETVSRFLMKLGSDPRAIS